MIVLRSWHLSSYDLTNIFVEYRHVQAINSVAKPFSTMDCPCKKSHCVEACGNSVNCKRASERETIKKERTDFFLISEITLRKTAKKVAGIFVNVATPKYNWVRPFTNITTCTPLFQYPQYLVFTFPPNMERVASIWFQSWNGPKIPEHEGFMDQHQDFKSKHMNRLKQKYLDWDHRFVHKPT